MVATRRMFPYAAVLAAALTLGACSGADPAPAETGAASTVSATSSSAPIPTSSVPSTTAAPTSEDPVLAKIPKEARAETPEGAKAFAAHFLTAISAAAEGADPVPLVGLSSDGCKTCRAMIQSIVELQRAGHHHAGETLRVKNTDLISHETRAAVVRVNVVQVPVDVLDKSGTKVDRTRPNSGAFVATMSYKNEHWVVDELQTMSS